jgi:hypothetical protein
VNRRQIVAGLGGAVAWPLAARAQPAAISVVGYLAGSLGLGENAKSFSDALAQAGYVEGPVWVSWSVQAGRGRQSVVRRLSFSPADRGDRKVSNDFPTLPVIARSTLREIVR